MKLYNFDLSGFMRRDSTELEKKSTKEDSKKKDWVDKWLEFFEHFKNEK